MTIYVVVGVITVLTIMAVIIAVMFASQGYVSILRVSFHIRVSFLQLRVSCAKVYWLKVCL